MIDLKKYISETERAFGITKYIVEKFRLSKDNLTNHYEPDDPTYWEVDDVLSGTYGYNMTLPVFYKIVKKPPKGFSVVKLTSKLASGHYNGSFTEVPDDSCLKDDLKQKPKTVRINSRGNVVIDRCYVTLWDGKPVWGNDMD